jgi:hypothetical protein
LGDEQIRAARDLCVCPFSVDTVMVLVRGRHTQAPLPRRAPRQAHCTACHHVLTRITA